MSEQNPNSQSGVAKTVLELACPNCRSKVLWNDDFPFRPFCSKRCQLTDFGEWANENHRIAGGNHDEDQLSEEPFDDY